MRSVGSAVNSEMLFRRMAAGSCLQEVVPKRQIEPVGSAGIAFIKPPSVSDADVAEKEDVGMGNHAVRACGKCKEEKPIIGRGLCGVCYHQEKKAGNLSAWGGAAVATPAETLPVSDERKTVTVEELKQMVDPSPTCVGDPAIWVPGMSPLEILLSPAIPTITLDFSEHPVLFQQLNDFGIDEEQIIELLSHLVSGDLRRVVRKAA